MKINRILKILILTNFVIISSLGLITPIFAIFIADKIIGGGVKVAGFAFAFYTLAFALTRLPAAYGVDRKMKENQRLYLLIGGTILVSLCYFLYPLVKFPWQIYILQCLIGIGFSLSCASFFSFFTRYINKGQESLEWGVYEVAISLGVAATAATSGILAAKFGFNIVFILAGIFVLLGSLIPILIYRDLIYKNEKPRNR